MGKHDGLGSGLNVKTLRVPDNVNWNEIHTWSALDLFPGGIADSERYKKTVYQRDSPHWSILATAWKPNTTTAVAAADQAIVKVASYSQPHPHVCIQEFSRYIWSSVRQYLTNDFGPPLSSQAFRKSVQVLKELSTHDRISMSH
jgi:hypothetical protein